jgi:putative zinc finger/helix-turn-helix YgiT family protein
MNAFCPICGTETNQKIIEKIEEINIRGEIIPVKIRFNHCNQCNEDFEIQEKKYDPMDEAFREFRKRRGLLQPEEIFQFRKKLGLTQKEMSEILGIGIASLNRYENGALQTEAMDKTIRYYMDEKNVLKKLDENPNLFNKPIRSQLKDRINNGDLSSVDVWDEFSELYFVDSPCEENGFMFFSESKLVQVFKFFCSKSEVSKTKLMKLLYYADHKHYKDYGVSITGSTYAHASFGPVLNRFETWLYIIVERESQVRREERIYDSCSGEIFISDPPDLSVFSETEIDTLSFVNRYFMNFSAKRIRDFSHKEKGYLETKNGEIISYKYALKLLI